MALQPIAEPLRSLHSARVFDVALPRGVLSRSSGIGAVPFFALLLVIVIGILLIGALIGTIRVAEIDLFGHISSFIQGLID